jgi:hypothetical protein
MGLLDLVGDIFGSNSQSKAISTAAQDQAQATQQALALQASEYGQAATGLLPYETTGTSALSQLAGMYGLANGGTVTAGGIVGGVNAGANLNPNATSATSQSTKSFAGTSEGGIDQAQAQAILTQRPDVQQAYNALSSQTKGYFGNDPNNYAAYWYNKYGAPGGFQLTNSVGQASQPAASTMAAPTPAGTYTNATGGASSVDPNASFYLSPDYNFALQQGLNGLSASYASQGLSGSGAAAKAAIQYSSGLATQDYQNYANTLKSLAGGGQSAAGSLAGIGQNYANTATGTITSGANAQASAALQQGNVTSNELSSIFGNLSGANLGSSFGGAISSAGSALGSALIPEFGFGG